MGDSPLPGSAVVDARSPKVSSDLPPESLPSACAHETLALDALVLDAGTQVRATLKSRVVELYAQALVRGDRFPPVVVFRVDGRNILSDGFYRVLACRKARRSDVDARVYHGTFDDAFWFALGATRAHGARVHPGDKRRAVELAYRAWPALRPVRLADHVGCGPSYASSIRAELRCRAAVLGLTSNLDASAPALACSPLHADRRSLSVPDVVADSRLDSVRVVPVVAPRGSVSRSPRSLPAAPSQLVPAPRVSGSSAGSGSDRLLFAFSAFARQVAPQSGSIDYGGLDRGRLAGWVADVVAARRHLGRVLLRLRRELRPSRRSGVSPRVVVGVDVAAVLDSLGLTVGEPRRAGNVACYALLCAIYAAHGGVFLTRVLRVLRDAYPSGRDCFRLRFVKGVALVLDMFPAVDDDVLVGALAAEPDGVRSLARRAARHRALLSGGYPECFAAAIVDVHNRAVALEGRLPEWFTVDRAVRFRSVFRFSLS